MGKKSKVHKDKDKDNWIRITEEEYGRLNAEKNTANAIEEANRKWNFSNVDKPKTKHETLDDFYNKLNARFTFQTFQDSQEILWYDSQQGVYRFNGEVKIKVELEKIFEEELKAEKLTYQIY